MNDRVKRRLVGVLQWAVALGALWYVGREVAWRETLALLSDVDPVVVGAVLVVTTLEFGTRFLMWWAILNGRRPTSWSDTARVDLVIKFVNHVVPSKASGHSVAPLVVRYYTGIDWSESVAVAALNTGLYALLYATVALGGVALFATRLPRGLLVVLGISTAIYLGAGTVVLVAGRRADLAGRLVARLRRRMAGVPRVGDRLAGLAGKLASFTDESSRVFRNLSSDPGVVVPYALGWLGTLAVFPGVRVWLVLDALGGSFSPAWLLPVVLVLAYSVTVLPVTPGGVGIAEASATLAFTSLGVRPELAVAVVIVDRAFGVYLPALIGWVPVANIDLADVLTSDG